MSEDIVFYTSPMSRGRIVRWMLEEVGAPYHTELVDFAAPKPPGLLAVNPMGKVPALTHKGVAITETAAICAYLADAFPAAGLAPAVGDPARASYLRWLFFAAGPIETAVLVKALGVAVEGRQEVMAGFGSFERLLATLEQALGAADYLAGDRFSAADLYLGSELGWAIQFGSIPARPVFEAYVGRINARPAAVRARQIDDDLIARAQKEAGTA